MKLFYKHIRNHDQARGQGIYQRRLNEKYEMYLNSTRRIINTNTNKTKSTNYNKIQVIYYHLDLGGTITVIVIQLVYKQCGCNYHTNAIRTGRRITHLHVATSDRTSGGFSPSSSKVINASSVYEYYVIKSGYDEYRLTKQNHSTALLNNDSQGKFLNRTPTYKDIFLQNLYNHPKEDNLAAYTRDGQK